MIDGVAIGAMEPRHMLERVGPGTLVIVPGDREDVILTLTTAHLARRFRVAGAAEAARIAQIAAEATNERTANVDGHEGAAIGLVLTGGYRPRDPVLAAIRQADLFATIVREDTYAVASEVHDLLVKTHPADREKIELIKGSSRSTSTSSGSWRSPGGADGLTRRLTRPACGSGRCRSSSRSAIVLGAGGHSCISRWLSSRPDRHRGSAISPASDARTLNERIGALPATEGPILVRRSREPTSTSARGGDGEGRGRPGSRDRRRPAHRRRRLADRPGTARKPREPVSWSLEWWPVVGAVRRERRAGTGHRASPARSAASGSWKAFGSTAGGVAGRDRRPVVGPDHVGRAVGGRPMDPELARGGAAGRDLDR